MSKQKFFEHGTPKSMHGYISEWVGEEKKAAPFLYICPECGAIEVKKRWYWDPEVPESRKKPHKEELCPGCKAIKNKWIEGEVVLKNRIIKLVPQQIENLIKNLEERFRHDDPKNRIVKIQKFKNMWKVFTASPFLARRIGEELEHTYQSKTSYNFAKDDRFVNVEWE